MVKLSDLLVADLRRELDRRGLDKTGLKHVLLDRLRQALAMDGVETDIEIEDEEQCSDDLALSSPESEGTEDTPDPAEEHLAGMAIAKDLSRTAAIAGLQGSAIMNPVEDVQRTETSGVGEEDMLALRTTISVLIQKVDSLSSCIEREREEARDRENRLSKKVRDLEKSISSLTDSVEDCFDKIGKKQHTILQQLKSRSKSDTPRCRVICEAEPHEQQRVHDHSKTTPAQAPKTTTIEQPCPGSSEADQKKTQKSTPAGAASSTESETEVHSATEQGWATYTRKSSASKRASSANNKTPPLHSPKLQNDSTTINQQASDRKSSQTLPAMTRETKKDLTGATRLEKAVFYVGGIAMECRVDSVMNYCLDRNVRVASCRFLPSRIFGTKSARLCVSADDADRQGILADGFWPEHLSVRPWHFEGEPQAQLIPAK